MKPERVIWEYVPTFYMPAEAWALVKGSWMRVNSADVSHSGWVPSNKELEAKFHDLPPLPEEAFRQYREEAKTPE